MLHAKFQGNPSTGFGEAFYQIYGRGGHLGQVTWTIYINLGSPIPSRLHIKFGSDWPSGF